MEESERLEPKWVIHLLSTYNKQGTVIDTYPYITNSHINPLKC